MKNNIRKVDAAVRYTIAAFPRFLVAAQLAAGFALLALGWFLGAGHLALLARGTETEGRVVDFRRATIDGNIRGFTGNFPIVEFQAGGDTVRFKDWKASAIPFSPSGSVPVLYDPDRPTSAMINRPIWNWLPWLPCASIGLLLVVAAVRRLAGRKA